MSGKRESKTNRTRRKSSGGLAGWWRQHRAWVSGLDRGQKIRYRLFQFLVVLAVLAIAVCLAARAWSKETGIVMETWTTQPGVQFYSGNYLDGCPAGKGGAPYAKRWGFCLETQHYPDSPHHPNFPSTVLPAGAKKRKTTEYRFAAE